MRARIPFRLRGVLAAMMFIGLAGLLAACSAIPFLGATPVPPNTLIYNAPVSLTIKVGTILSGTTIAYSGKSETGAAKVLITGLLAPKQVGDTLDWEGVPVPDTKVKLSTRVISFDDKAITLVGTARIEIANVTVQSGGTAGTELMEFDAPVTYTLGKNELVPGSKLIFAGATPEGAQFLGVDGIPYRKQFDSLQYVGRLNARVFLQLDLRVVSYSDTGAVVGGRAVLKLEQ